MKMTGIIFSNIYDASLGDLTQLRTVASLPFGGRYRLVDFQLSNMVNSNISSIGIITKYNYQSLMDHLGSGLEWDLNQKSTNLHILPPFVTGITNVYRGNLEALSNAVRFLQATKPDYILMCDTSVICNINFEDVLKKHVESGADVTAIASESIESYEKDGNDLHMKVDADGKVCDLSIGIPIEEGDLTGMGMFIVERKFLINIINNYVSRGRYSFEKDFLLSSFNAGSVKINVFKFEGPVLRNHNILSYFKNNFKLMDENVRSNIFYKKSPIYTKVRDEAPTYYADDCKVSDCLIADGCVISGKLENAVLFRDVKIEEGAIVKNAVVMQGSVICKGARIENAIIDKDATITSGAVIIGGASSPMVIHKGETI